MEGEDVSDSKADSDSTPQEAGGDPDQDELHRAMSFWRDRLTAWYPDLLSRTYFLPPVHMNRTQYSAQVLAGQDVFVAQVPHTTALPRGDRVSLRESDVREDLAQQRVLQCLHQIAAAAEGWTGDGGKRSSRAKMPEAEAAEQEALTPDAKMPEAEAAEQEALTPDAKMPEAESAEQEALTPEAKMPEAEAAEQEALTPEAKMPEAEAAEQEALTPDAKMPEAESAEQEALTPDAKMPEAESAEQEALTPEAKMPEAEAAEQEALTPDAKMPEAESAEQEALTPDGGNNMPRKEASIPEKGNMPEEEALTSETGNMLEKALTPDGGNNMSGKEALMSETGTIPEKALIPERGNMPEKQASVPETGNMPEKKALTSETENMPEKEALTPETGRMPEKEALMKETGNMPEKEALKLERGNMSEKEALKPERGNMFGKEALKPERGQQNPEVFDKQGAQKVSTPDLTAREKRTAGTEEQITKITQNKHTEKAETSYSRQQKRGTKEQQAKNQELSTETTEPTAVLQEYRGHTVVQKPVNTQTHIAEKGVGADPETLTQPTELTARLQEQNGEAIQKQQEDPQTRRAENCPGTDIEALKQTPQPTTQLQEQRRQTVQKQQDTQTRADPAEKCDEKDDDAGEDYPATQANKEVMFVISQLKFENYLSQHCFSGDAKLPKPSDLKEEKRDRGDFDILVIHRNHGVLVGEIKSVGDRLGDKSEEQQHRIIADKIRLAMKQLDKAESVLHHLFSDKARRPRIRKSVILPNVTANCLRRVLAFVPLLKEELCGCLRVDDSADPVPLCLTSDVLSSPNSWWQLLMTGAGSDPAMSDPVYLDLVSRFGGPATTVSVFCPSVPRLGYHSDIRTESEAVSETAGRFTQLVVHPGQLAILRSDPPLAYLTGPPGTGKTLVLVLKALEWLRDGHDVHVVSTWDESLSVSHVIVCQIQGTEPEARSRVHLHEFDLWKQHNGVEMAVATLVALSRPGGVLHVLTDEVGPDSTDPKRRFAVFCSTLHQCLPNLRLWAASMYHEDRPAATLTECILTEPLRMPPNIAREVRKSSSLGPGGPVLDYTLSSAPAPADGVPVRVVYHTEDHTTGSPADCEKCGGLVARVLTRELRVGETVPGRTSSNAHQLHYKDVLILIRHGDVRKMQIDAEGHKTHVDCGLVRGLRDQGVPVQALLEGSRDMATMTGPDEVVVTFSGNTLGLERKVVVWTRYDEWGEEWGRLLAMSRCTGQLIIVRKP